MHNNPDPSHADESTVGNEESDEIQLTTEQENALVLDRNVAITAGAGTGKTTTLTERYLTILDENPDVDPEDIVTITFTRKAAAELRTRVREEVYDRLETVESSEQYDRWRDALDALDDGYIHTIHAFCARLLRENGVQAPVTLGFDVLDEEKTATLQHETVVEFLETQQENSDVELLSRLWNHGHFVDALTGLLSERPASVEWLDHWRDATVEDYMDVLRTEISEFDTETAREIIESSSVGIALDTVDRLDEANLDVDENVDGIRLLRKIATISDDLPSTRSDADDKACQHAVLKLYNALQTTSGDLYSSASYHVMGKKGNWGGETDAYDDFKIAVNSLIDSLEPHEDVIKTAPGELEHNSAHYVLALARVFDEVLATYQKAKDQHNALDFSDLIETTIEFLETDDVMRADLQSKFAAVMVDEFQDTDPLQWRLVKLLTGVDDDAQHVFLVGDEKQSIYAFRGADVTTFGTARQDLHETNARQGIDFVPGADTEQPTRLELSGNFRTLKQPLSFINELFNQLFRAEADEHASFEAEPQSLSTERSRVEEIDDLKGSVEYMLVPSESETAAAVLGDDHPVVNAAAEHTLEAEAHALAARLTHLFADPPHIQDPESGEHRDATPEDVAILLRRRTHLDRYQRALDEQDIPYTVVGGTGFYDTPEVQPLINLLRVLADPEDGISLYGVLRSPLFGFTDDRLASVARDADLLWNALETADDPQLKDAYNLLTAWRTLAGCDTPGEDGILPWGRLLTRVIDDTGYLMSVGADERGRQAVANVEKFRDQVRNWSERGIQTAASLLHHIDRQAELEPREGDADIPEGSEGIRIMTIHSAKGLEFPVVTVPDIGSSLNFGRSIDEYGHVRLINEDEEVPPLLAIKSPSPTDSYSMEKTVAHTYADTQSLPRERAEAKRLLYVACTRVRDHLLLCGTHDIKQGSDGRYKLSDTAEFDEATRWRDWLQPQLLDHGDVLADLFATKEATATLGEADCTIRLPPRPTSFDVTDEPIDDPPAIEIPVPVSPEFERRVTATDVVTAVSNANGEFDEGDEVTRDSQGEVDGIPPTVFGTIVHRLAELRPTTANVDEYARRVAGMAGHDVTADELEQIHRHAIDAIDYIRALESEQSVSTTYDELSVTAELDEYHIVGDIDHLTVTPETYFVTDYKTNQTRWQSPQELAEHYQPQMLCYALALHQHDPERDVHAALRFTDAGVTEEFHWRSNEMETVRSELRSMLVHLDT